jgi:hypothetical protein
MIIKIGFYGRHFLAIIRGVFLEDVDNLWQSYFGRGIKQPRDKHCPVKSALAFSLQVSTIAVKGHFTNYQRTRQLKRYMAWRRR